MSLVCMCMIGCCIKSSVSCASASIHVSLHSSICLCLHFVTQGSYLAAQGIECVGERIDSCAWIKARFSVCACICISTGTVCIGNETGDLGLELSLSSFGSRLCCLVSWINGCFIIFLGLVECMVPLLFSFSSNLNTSRDCSLCFNICLSPSIRCSFNPWRDSSTQLWADRGS